MLRLCGNLAFATLTLGKGFEHKLEACEKHVAAIFKETEHSFNIVVL